MRHRVRLTRTSLVAVSLSILSLLARPGAARAAEQLWFDPGDDLTVQGVVTHPDFEELFTSAASWPVGVRNVNVFQIRAPWFLGMPAGVVERDVQFLRQNNIQLAVPLGGVPSSTCGQGIEGIMTLKQMEVYAKGIQLKHIAVTTALLDEPLYFGRDYHGVQACNFTTAEVAKRVATSVRMVRKYFPDIQIALVEPIQSLPGGPAELAAFLDDYKRNLGAYPVLVRFDMNWAADWQASLKAFIGVVTSRSIGLSVIYNATAGGAAIDALTWIASAKANVIAFENQTSTSLNAVSIQSWNTQPVNVVPELDPTSMSGFLRWYIQHRQAQ